MLDPSPHPVNRHPVGLLELRPVLLPSPPPAQAVVCSRLPPLDFLLLAARLAELYEMIFPEQPALLEEEIWEWRDEEAVAKAVERFLKQVARRFPLYDEFWEVDLELIQWRLYEIPVLPMGFDIWHESWEDFLEPAPYLLHMDWSRSDETDKRAGNEFQQLYPDQQVPRYLAPDNLVETLRRMTLPAPLDALPDLIQMLNGDAGNFWLDTGELSLMEGGGYPSWDAAAVEMLAAEWTRAAPVLDRVHALLNWRNETAEAAVRKITAVREALLEAQRRQEPGYAPQLKMEFPEEVSDGRDHAPNSGADATFAP
jgi:hypothetical protein